MILFAPRIIWPTIWPTFDLRHLEFQDVHYQMFANMLGYERYLDFPRTRDTSSVSSKTHTNWSTCPAIWSNIHINMLSWIFSADDIWSLSTWTLRMWKVWKSQIGNYLRIFICSLTAVTWNESTQATESSVAVGPAVVNVSKSNLHRKNAN